MPRENQRTTLEKLSASGYGALIDVPNQRDQIDPTELKSYVLQLRDKEFDQAVPATTVATLIYQKDVSERYMRDNEGRPAPQPIYSSDAMQGFLDAVMSMTELTGMKLGGICTVYDAIGDPSPGEVIDVASAIEFGYPGILPGASDSDVFIVVHALHDRTLYDLTYGNDIAVASVDGGSILIQNGKVRKQQAAPDVVLTFPGAIVSTNYDTVTGTSIRPRTLINIQQDTFDSGSGGSGCTCNPEPPTPPTPPTPPAPGGTNPPMPEPNKPVKVNWDCVDILVDNGFGISAPDVPIGTSHVTLAVDVFNQTATNIHDTIITALIAQGIHPGCDLVYDIELKLSLELTTNINEDIANFILSLLGIKTNSRPYIIKTNSDSTYNQLTWSESYRINVSSDDLGVSLGVPIPSIFNEVIYDNQILRPSFDNAIDRHDFPIGRSLAFWATGFHAFVKKFGNLRLQLCGATVKYAQPIMHFPADGTELVTGLGTVAWDVYENYALTIPAGSFFGPDGIQVDTDQVHGRAIMFGTCKPLTEDKTMVYGSCHFKDIPGGSLNDGSTVFLRVEQAGTPNVWRSAGQFVANDGEADLVFSVAVPAVAGSTYNLGIDTDSFPDHEYFIKNVIAYML